MAETGERPDMLEEPLDKVEQYLIASYIAAAGFDIHEIWQRQDAEAHALLAAASRYASEKLSEVEARAHYLKRLHGDE